MRSEARGSLERHLPRPEPAEDELFAMRQAAWRQQGIVVLRVADVRDELIRQALVNEATRLYGQREVASWRGGNGRLRHVLSPACR